MILTLSPLLLTAFEPFGGAAVNASLEVARLLVDADASITLAVLPVVRGEAERIALAALQSLIEAGTPPALVLSLGEAPRPHVCLEAVAVNQDDFPIPDNAGNQPRGEPILPGGPDVWAATLPLEELAAELRGATPVPVVVSRDAGTFLCNHLAYRLGRALAASPLPYGFVHVPAVRSGGKIGVDAVAQTLRALLEAARGRAGRTGDKIRE